MNNNENQNNESLNTISLGNVGPTPPEPVAPVASTPEPTPVTPVSPMEAVPPVPTTENVEPVAPLNAENVESLEANVMDGPLNMEETPQTPVPPVAPTPQPAPIPPVSPVAPVSPVPPVSNYEVPETINNFNSTPVFDDIGTVPPIPNNPVPNVEEPKKPKKKGGNKLLFVIVVLLAITAVGVGVYIFLSISSGKNAVVVKQVNIELGSSVSTNINDYATFKNIDVNTCSLDTTKITDTSTLGSEYPFNIKCGEYVYTGKAKIVDTTVPEVTMKEELTVALNSTVKPEDFIENCNDASDCTYEFKEEAKVTEYLKTAASYKIDIIIKDAAGNEVIKTATLTVSNDGATTPEPSDPNSSTTTSKYLGCPKTKDNLNYKLKYGMTSENVLTGKVIKS